MRLRTCGTALMSAALVLLAPTTAHAADAPVAKGHAGQELRGTTYHVPNPSYDDLCHTLSGMGSRTDCWGTTGLFVLIANLPPGAGIEQTWRATITEKFVCEYHLSGGSVTLKGVYDSEPYFIEPLPTVRANGDFKASGSFALHSPNPNGPVNPDGSNGIYFPCQPGESVIRLDTTLTNVSVLVQLPTGKKYRVQVPGTYHANPYQFITDPR